MIQDRLKSRLDLTMAHIGIPLNAQVSNIQKEMAVTPLIEHLATAGCTCDTCLGVVEKMSWKSGIRLFPFE